MADGARASTRSTWPRKRKFDQDMQRETLKRSRAWPGLELITPSCSTLVVILADAVPSAPGPPQSKRKKINRYRRTPSCPHRRPTPPIKKRRSGDEYYPVLRARCFVRALDKGRMTELQLGQELAKIALEAESLPRYGDDEEYYDETAPGGYR